MKTYKAKSTKGSINQFSLTKSKSDYIENASQLRNKLIKSNIFNSKTLFNFILSSLQCFTVKNYSLFYQILGSLIDKINTLQSDHKYNKEDIRDYIKLFIQMTNDNLVIINKKFDDIYIENSLLSYITCSKHSRTVFLFSLMVTFSYVSYEIDNAKTPKREAYHLINKLKHKYICKDFDRIMCQYCSLNCFTLLHNYFAGFIYNSKQDMRMSISLSVTTESNLENCMTPNKLLDESRTNNDSSGEEVNGKIVYITSLMEEIDKDIKIIELMIDEDQCFNKDLLEKIGVI